MHAKVAGVEKPRSFALDQQHVRIDCAMVGQEGRDPEGTAVEGAAAAGPAGNRPIDPSAEQGRGEAHQLGRSLARHHRPVSRKLIDQPPMVHVRMADEDGRGPLEVEGPGKQSSRVARGVERSADVEDQPLAIMFDLYAASADLPRAAIPPLNDSTWPYAKRQPLVDFSNSTFVRSALTSGKTHTRTFISGSLLPDSGRSFIRAGSGGKPTLRHSGCVRCYP